MAQAFGGNRGLQPIPPEKGVFPLDHLQECKQVVESLLCSHVFQPIAFYHSFLCVGAEDILWFLSAVQSAFIGIRVS
jgi:hypothetical protein